MIHPVIRSVTLAIMLVLVSTGARPAAAQPDPVSILRQLPGVQTACARKYLSADLVATPGAATPQPPPRQLAVTATALAFASPPDTLSALDFLRRGATLRRLLGEPFGTITTMDASAAGPEATVSLVRTDIGDGNAHALLIAHRGTLIIMIRADGPEASLRPALVRFAQFMMERTATGTTIPGATPVTSSDVACWTLFPGAEDHAVLQGLIPTYDYDLLGPTGDTPIPAATPAG